MKGLLDKGFIYTPAVETDIRKRFEAERKRIEVERKQTAADAAEVAQKLAKTRIKGKV